jgi:hypothetical protein
MRIATSTIHQCLHLAQLSNVVYDISTSRTWRRRLFSAAQGTLFLVNHHAEDLSPNVHLQLMYHHLEFLVATAEPSPATGWNRYTNHVFFQVSARRYPSVVAWSANNPDSI